MEKTLSVILIIAALIIGVVCGVVFTLSEDCETCKVCPEVPVCEECVSEPCPVQEPVICGATPNGMLDVAIVDFLDYLDDEDELVCDGDEYDKKEVTVRTVYDELSVEYFDDDEYEVTGAVKLNFKEDDEKRCRQTFDFKILYEEDEDPDVTILE